MCDIKNILEKLDICYQNKYDLLFETYYKRLISENEKYNLTAITKKEEVYEKHFFDSLAGACLFENGASVADVGSGAGFPSVPVAIIRPDLKFLLVDGLRKRVDFLNGLISELGLVNVDAVHSRIEDIKRRDFDCVVARAVAPLPTLLEYTLPFVRVGGKVLAYKGPGFQEELNASPNALSTLGGRLSAVLRYGLSDGAQRAILSIEKFKATPSKFPRGGNKPKSNPL